MATELVSIWFKLNITFQMEVGTSPPHPAVLGRGGMATVFLGEREGADFRQRAAIKLLRGGLYTPLEERLFRREQRALASLSHPMWRITLGLSVVAAIWAFALRPLSPRIGPVPVSVADGWAIDAPAAQGIDAARLDSAITSLLDAPLNVHSVLVGRGGKLVAEYYQGGKDRSVYALVSTRQSFGPTTKQDIRSIGKSITSLLYGLALSEGKVPALSSPVFDAYPALVDIATPEKRSISVRDLLNMANGLQWHEGDVGLNDELRLFWKQDITRYVLSHDAQAAPNTEFNYNGGGNAILADLISRGTGMALDDYARSRLFEPLGGLIASTSGKPGRQCLQLSLDRSREWDK